MVGKYWLKDIAAPKNIPAFDNSAMDGFAFDHHDYQNEQRSITSGARELPPEKINRLNWHNALLPGYLLEHQCPQVQIVWQCRKIAISMTVRAKRLSIYRKDIKKGANVRLAGEDVKSGERLLSAGSRLRPQDIAAIASCGLARIEIYDPSENCAGLYRQ